MPTYQFKCTECQSIVDKILSISERDKPLSTPCTECGGQLSKVVGSPKIVSGVRTTDKRPDGWRDVLKNIHKKAGKKSTVNP